MSAMAKKIPKMAIEGSAVKMTLQRSEGEVKKREKEGGEGRGGGKGGIGRK